MKHCVQFPKDENILVVRPCLVAICGGNRSAAKLLSVLLFRGNLRIENKDDAKNLNQIKTAQGQTADQDISTRIYRKQAQLVDDMCGEITEKTLHDVAVPWLQLLGYLDIQEFTSSNCYDVHFEAVQAALDIYVNNPRQLEKFLIDHLQLEKFLIDVQIEKFPIDKKSFLLALEKILIANRNISNAKRGRKPTSEGHLGGISRRLKNLKEITKKNKEEESITDDSEIPPVASPLVDAARSPSEQVNDEEETLHRLPAVQKGQSDDISHSQHNRSHSRGLGTPHRPGHPQSREALPAGDGGDTAPARRDVELDPPRASVVESRPVAETPAEVVLCAYCQEPAEITCQDCGKHVCYEEHGRVFPVRDVTEYYCLPCLKAHNAFVTAALVEQKKPVQNVDQNGSVSVFHALVEPNESADQKTPRCLIEPDMTGKWSSEKCVQYAEWCNGKCYSEKMYQEQMKAAETIHKNDRSLTLEQYKRAYDERYDPWWREHKKKLHVSDMKARGKSGIDRVHEMLQRIEDNATPVQKSPRLQVIGGKAQEDLIEWQGRWMTKEQAYQCGYLGGWERYKGQVFADGQHPLDSIDETLHSVQIGARI